MDSLLLLMDRNEDAMQPLAAKGAVVAKTPLEVAERSDVVITMLPASAHVSDRRTFAYNGNLRK